MDATGSGPRLAIVVLAILEAGWLAFDGGRALIVGDYVTPSSGPHAGQLGPWATIVSAVGIDPRSTLMKAIHLGLGTTWLVVTTSFVLRMRLAWWGMLVRAVLGLWYLPFGTLLSILQMVLPLLPTVREAGRGDHPTPSRTP